MLTEAEAREKWCPIFEHAGDEPVKCLASDCAMWRWVGPVKWAGTMNARTPEESDGEWVREGYCGLAGRPEVV